MKNLYLSVIACAIITLCHGQENSNNFHLKLQAIMGNGDYNTDFYFNDNSSSGIDRGYDAAVFNYTAPSTSIYSKLADGSYSNIDFAIQSLHTTALGSDIVVPLGINAAQGQQVTVRIAETSLPTSVGVLLEDNVTGISTLLNFNNYSFTPSSNLNGAGRFTLRFTTQNLSNPHSSFNDIEIYSTMASRNLYIKGQLTETANIFIYDINGTLVLSTDINKSLSSHQVDVSGLNSGVYIVKLKTDFQQKTKRVVLK